MIENIVGNFEVEFLFDGHREIDKIKAVCAEISGNNDLSVTTNAFLNPLFFISGANSSLAPFPKYDVSFKTNFVVDIFISPYTVILKSTFCFEESGINFRASYSIDIINIIAVCQYFICKNFINFTVCIFPRYKRREYSRAAGKK